jgi:stage II sporulation protein M
MAGIGMRKFRFQLNRPNIIQVAIILLIIGLFLGIVCANVFQESYTKRLQVYEDNVFTEIAGSEIDHAGLFRYILGNNFGDFIMFWLLSITILGIPYMALKITSFGFFAGFFISAVTMEYGFKGLLLVLVYLFPHGLMYLPILLICLYKGYTLSRDIYQSSHTSLPAIIKPVRENLLIIILLAVALVFASFLEAYPGAYFLKKALGLFL